MLTFREMNVTDWGAVCLQCGADNHSAELEGWFSR